MAKHLIAIDMLALSSLTNRVEYLSNDSRTENLLLPKTIRRQATDDRNDPHHEVRKRAEPSVLHSRIVQIVKKIGVRDN